jgi:VanZ family protein
MAVVWAVVIVAWGVLPIGGVVEKVGPADPVTTTGHFIAYMVLGFALPLALGARPVPLQRLVLAFALAVALGAAVELIQGPIPYRDASFLDLAVDAAGAAVGLAVVSAVARGGRSRSRPG